MEAAVIVEGNPGFVTKPIFVIATLKNPSVFATIPEVEIPVKFVCLIVDSESKTLTGLDNADRTLGYAFGSTLTDPLMVKRLYGIKTELDLCEAFNQYLSSTNVLPREWNVENLILPPNEGQQKVNFLMDEDDELDTDRRMWQTSGLVKSGRIFGGLKEDLKRKKSNYISDFMDLHPQCISAVLFIYFATLAPLVAFGGLLGKATGNRIATMECLVSGLICGVVFSLLSGQPMIILGLTGPVYVFEKILFNLCESQAWDYLSFRMWIGLWVGLILLILVLTDSSAYVCFITRFTEEIFATLCAAIYVYNACVNMVKIGTEHHIAYRHNVTAEEDQQHHVWEEDNVVLMSVVDFVGTIAISVGLKAFRKSRYLPGFVRNLLADFSVFLSIVVMAFLDHSSGVNTPKLQVPDEFKPTFEGRNWVRAFTHPLQCITFSIPEGDCPHAHVFGSRSLESLVGGCVPGASPGRLGNHPDFPGPANHGSNR